MSTPEALRLADLLETDGWPDAATELRRLHDLLGKANALNRIRAERMSFKEIRIGDYALRFYPSDNGWMCGITPEMMQVLEEKPESTGKQSLQVELELESVTYPTAGAFLEEGWYSADDLRDILKSLADLNPGDDYA
jgi:hypothetical protein